jgi:rod shape-determining protein MreD
MRYWALSVIGLVAYLIQSVLGEYVMVAGVAPSPLLDVTVAFGLLFGWRVGLGAGIFGGLLLDLTAGRFIGLHLVSIGVVGLLVGLLEELIFKDNLLLAGIIGFLGSGLANGLSYAFLALLGWRVDPIHTLTSAILPAAIYNGVLTLLIYSQLYRHYQYLRPNPRGTIVLRR